MYIMMSKVLLLLCAAALSDSKRTVNWRPGTESGDVVADGDRRLLPCTSAQFGQSYTWELCRVSGPNPCEPTSLEGNAAGQSLDVTISSLTTGRYTCVAEDDRRTILDEYYLLSADEWLQLYPNHLVIKHHERATLFIRILQLPRSLQISSFRLYFRSLNDSENQLMRIVLPFEIKNGFTVQVFNTTSLTNGYITVSARFAVGGIFHTVASTVGLSVLEKPIPDPNMSGTLKCPLYHHTNVTMIMLVVAGVLLSVSAVVNIVMVCCLNNRKKKVVKTDDEENDDGCSLQEAVEEMSNRRPEHLGQPLVPRTQAVAVTTVADVNGEHHLDVSFSPRPQSGPMEQRTVEGSPSRSLFPADVMNDVRSSLSDDRLSIRTQHEESYGFDGQRSAADVNLLPGGSPS